MIPCIKKFILYPTFMKESCWRAFRQLFDRKKGFFHRLLTTYRQKAAAPRCSSFLKFGECERKQGGDARKNPGLFAAVEYYLY